MTWRKLTSSFLLWHVRLFPFPFFFFSHFLILNPHRYIIDFWSVKLTMWHDLREYEIIVALRAQKKEKKRDLKELSFLPFHLTHSTPTTRRDDDFFISYFHHALVPPLVEWRDCGHSASHPQATPQQSDKRWLRSWGCWADNVFVL